MTSPLRAGRRSNQERIAAAVEMLAGVQPVADLSVKYGVGEDVLNVWRDAAQRGLQLTFGGCVKDSDARTETIAGLMRENKRLRDEMRATGHAIAAAAETCRQLTATLDTLKKEREA